MKSQTEAKHDQADLLTEARMRNRIEELKAKLEERPDDAALCNELGDAWYDKSQYLAAVECYKKAISLDPHVAQYHNNLGYTCFITGLLDQAIEAYHEAIRIEPDNGLFHNNLSAALMKKAGQPFK